MSHYVVYDGTSGKILVTGYCTDGSEEHQGENVLVVDEAVQGTETHYVASGKLCCRPVAPSDYHKWNDDEKIWEPDRDRLIATLKDIETERFNKRLSEPVTVKGASYDASESSINAIQRRLQENLAGFSLPENFVWKDSSNTFHPCNVELLEAILHECLSRDFSLRQTLWENKAKIEAMTFEEALSSLEV